jgi:hypothetical protein
VSPICFLFDGSELTMERYSSVDIPYSEGPVNLNWSAIMKTVNEDPQDFFAEGGWGFLAEKDDVRPPTFPLPPTFTDAVYPS